MNFEMMAAKEALSRLLDNSGITRGLYIRIYGKLLILGRDPGDPMESWKRTIGSGSPGSTLSPMD